MDRGRLAVACIAFLVHGPSTISASPAASFPLVALQESIPEALSNTNVSVGTINLQNDIEDAPFVPRTLMGISFVEPPDWIVLDEAGGALVEDSLAFDVSYFGGRAKDWDGVLSTSHSTAWAARDVEAWLLWQGPLASAVVGRMKDVAGTLPVTVIIADLGLTSPIPSQSAVKSPATSLIHTPNLEQDRQLLASLETKLTIAYFRGLTSDHLKQIRLDPRGECDLPECKVLDPGLVREMARQVLDERREAEDEANRAEQTAIQKADLELRQKAEEGAGPQFALNVAGVLVVFLGAVAAAIAPVVYARSERRRDEKLDALSRSVAALSTSINPTRVEGLSDPPPANAASPSVPPAANDEAAAAPTSPQVDQVEPRAAE